MSETTSLNFPEAARRLGVPLRVLRRAIRERRLPAPEQTGATAHLSEAWLTKADEAAKASPGALRRHAKQATPAFARYPGTSCWRKYRARVREFARFQRQQETS